MDTIYALSSGAGRAAVAVLRISGDATASVLTALCGGLPVPRRATLRTFRRPADGETIDIGLAIWFPGPASYTGEDMCELHLHGSRAVVESMFATLRQRGVRAADAGEFSRRAFANGKLDLSELEGIADLLSAETELQRRQAISQASGGLRARCDAWSSKLLDLRAQIEARLDFSDEGDVGSALSAGFWRSIDELRADMTAVLQSARSGERVRDGYRVAILGRPNVGKSSLLNALARRDAAIVTSEPGTTRDVVELLLDLDGCPVRLFDTAGIRDALSEAERIGIGRAVEAGWAADLVLLVDEASGDDVSALPSCGGRVLRVGSKSDLASIAAPGRLDVSAHTGEGLPELIAAVRTSATAALGDGSGLVARERQRVAVVDAVSALSAVFGESDEIVADLLRTANDAIGRVTGRVGAEDVLDRLFAEFCIGK